MASVLLPCRVLCRSIPYLWLYLSDIYLHQWLRKEAAIIYHPNIYSSNSHLQTDLPRNFNLDLPGFTLPAIRPSDHPRPPVTPQATSLQTHTPLQYLTKGPKPKQQEQKSNLDRSRNFPRVTQTYCRYPRTYSYQRKEQLRSVNMPGMVPELPGIKAPHDMTLRCRQKVARLINRQNINFPGKLSQKAGSKYDKNA